MRLHTWLHLTPQNFSTSRFLTIISVTCSRDISVLCGHENVSLAHIFETERLFPSAVIEAHAHEDSAHRVQEYFCHFIVLEVLNTHTCMPSLQVSS